MSIFNELDHFLGVNESGLREYEDGAALNNRLSEWLATPMSTVADNPSWGHNLRPFWHDPESPSLAMEMEMALVRKLPRDVRDITILRVGVEFRAKDYCMVEIHHQMGQFQEELAIGQELSRGIF